MNRRGFLGTILAGCVAPAVVKAEWLMPTRVLLPAPLIYTGVGTLQLTGRTNFAQLTAEQKAIWSKDVWAHAREMSFVNRFLGESEGFRLVNGVARIL